MPLGAPRAAVIRRKEAVVGGIANPLDFPNTIAWYSITDSTVNTDVGITLWSDLETVSSPGDLGQTVDGLEPALNSTPTRATFDGTDDDLAAGAVPSTFLTSRTAFWFAVLLRIVSNSRDNADPWTNSMVVGDPNTFMGLHIKGTVSPFTLQAYVWDGAAKVAETTLAEDTWAVVHYFHDGTNIAVAVDDGTPVTTAAGAFEASDTDLRMGNLNRSPNMDVLDFIAHDGSPTAQQRADYTTWAKAKYGV